LLENEITGFSFESKSVKLTPNTDENFSASTAFKLPWLFGYFSKITLLD
jgi:hypothetical protein